jgi:hypothetical protein
VSTQLGFEMARRAGRPQWSVLYRSGQIVSAWDCDWLDLPWPGRAAIRLYSTVGTYAELSDPSSSNLEGRLFQFGVGLGGLGSPSVVLAHVIGIVDQADGGCRCYAWETATQRFVGFRDQFNRFAYQHMGPLSALALGVRL